MKIDNIDNIANKEKSPDKAERSASIDEIKKTQKFFDFNDLSSNAATINNKSLIIPEKDPIFDYISPGSSKLKKLLLNSDPEVANLNINNEKVHNSEYLNNNNNNDSNNLLPLDSTNSSSSNNNNTNSLINNSIGSLRINNGSNSLLKSKCEGNNNLVALNSNKNNGERKSVRNLTKQKLFWCSECNEYFLKLNLFNHMKSVHNKFTCLYCYGFFVKIESLEKHLVKKHKVQNTSFYDEQTLRSYFVADEEETTETSVSTTKVIKAVCCKCGTIFEIADNNFHEHCCTKSGETNKSSIKETVQNISSENITSLAVHSNLNCTIDNSNLTTSFVNQLNSAKDDELYCEKAIQQWLQPNVKTFNGGMYAHCNF